MQQQQEISRTNKFKQIFEKLKQYQKQNLKLICFHDYGDCIQTTATVMNKETNQKYTLKIYNMYDGVNSICRYVKRTAENEKKSLQKNNHPNIIKYVDQFTIGNHYFILMEYHGISVQEWMGQMNRYYHPIHALRYSKQLISALRYLHGKNLELKHFSLNQIFIDEKNVLKIYRPCQVYKISQRLIEDLQILSQSDQNVPYFLPSEMMTQCVSSQYIQFTKSGDIWQFGIFLYFLAGATSIDTVKAGNRQIRNLEYQNPKVNELINLILNTFQSMRPQAKEVETKLNEIYQKQWDEGNVERELMTEAQNSQNTSPLRAIFNLFVLIEHKPTSTEYICFLADIFRKYQKFDDAIESYKKCINLDPTNEMYRAKLSETLENKSRQEGESSSNRESNEDLKIMVRSKLFQNMIPDYIRQEINTVHPDSLRLTQIQIYMLVLTFFSLLQYFVYKYY